jgi:hypothetical protein
MLNLRWGALMRIGPADPGGAAVARGPQVMSPALVVPIPIFAGIRMPSGADDCHDEITMRLRSALQVICTALLVWISVVSSASSANRRVVLLFDERPELPGLAQLEAELVRMLVSSSAEPIAHMAKSEGCLGGGPDRGGGGSRLLR